MTGGRAQRLLAWIGLAFVVVVTVGAAAFALMLHSGVSTRDEPSGIEATIARAAKRLAVPAGARALAAPPEVFSSISLADARAHWASHCANCHADDGSGATPMGRNLYPRPPDMRAKPTQQLTDGELYFVIKNGVRLTGMPAWGEPGGADLETWALVAFIKTLPRLTADELAEIRRSTPRTRHDLEEELEDESFLKGATPTHSEHKEPHP